MVKVEATTGLVKLFLTASLRAVDLLFGIDETQGFSKPFS
jgi:hypothetical protein